MNYLLVVDDSAVDRQIAKSLIERRLPYQVEFASSGWEALEHIESQLPLAVITDLQMPEMDGLKLTEAIHRHYSTVPVILMTAHGSEEIAAEALLRGAADYIPKDQLADELCRAIQGVLEVAEGSTGGHRLQRSLRYEKTSYELENDLRAIAPLVDHLQFTALHLQLVDHSERIRLAKALVEALRNAIYHGNLELTPDEVVAARLSPASREAVLKRRQGAPFETRRVCVTSTLSPDEGRFVIRDEGPGFDTSNLPDISQHPDALSRGQRRGLVLIRAFMDEVRFNDTGNEITLVKRRRP